MTIEIETLYNNDYLKLTLKNNKGLVVALTDTNGNTATVERWGTVAFALLALNSLKDCKNCVNCEECTGCVSCVECSQLVGGASVSFYKPEEEKISYEGVYSLSVDNYGLITQLTDTNGNTSTIAQYENIDNMLKALNSLRGCSNCLDCDDCENCIDCISCSLCIDCVSCELCMDSRYCKECDDCLKCVDCTRVSGEENIYDRNLT